MAHERKLPHWSPGDFPGLAVILSVSALLKLLFMRVDRAFEAHTMALEWLASGLFRYHYFGSWDATFQFPVYTAVVAAIYGLGLDPWAVLVFQIACGTATAFLIHRIALHLLVHRTYKHAVALGSAGLTALSPFLAYYQVRMIHPFAWDGLLATGLLYAALRATPERRGSLLTLFALGGWVLLNRPTLGVFMLPFLIQHFRFIVNGRSLPLKLGLVVLLFGPLALWLVRNERVSGRYQLTSVTDQMIWMGLQEETEGSGHLADGRSYAHLLSQQEQFGLFAMGPAERSTFFRSKWQAELDATPGLWWRMMLVKLKNFWSFRSHLGLDHGSALSTWAMWAYRVMASLVLLLLLACPFVGDRRLGGPLLAVVCLSVIQCAFYFETRHRLLAEPVLLCVALATAFAIRERWMGIGPVK
ncbi:MAG: hypothetical protein ACO1NQ_02155 [Flavobacteriales bacterium]